MISWSLVQNECRHVSRDCESADARDQASQRSGEGNESRQAGNGNIIDTSGAEETPMYCMALLNHDCFPVEVMAVEPRSCFTRDSCADKSSHNPRLSSELTDEAHAMHAG